jgi:hypothetical protein
MAQVKPLKIGSYGQIVEMDASDDLVLGSVTTSGSISQGSFTQSVASVSTSNATPTVIASVATTSNSAIIVEVDIIGARVSGSGSPGDAACYKRICRVVNLAGVLTISSIETAYTSEAVLIWDCSFSNSGSTIQIKVIGEASTTINWKAVVRSNYVGF